jgi:hypothetical protein
LIKNAPSELDQQHQTSITSLENQIHLVSSADDLNTHKAVYECQGIEFPVVKQTSLRVEISLALCFRRNTHSHREQSPLSPTTLLSAHSSWTTQTPTQTQRLSFPAIALPPQVIAMAARTNTTQTSAQLL